MIKKDIPGRGSLELEYLLLDYNGTLALDGYLMESVPELISRLAEFLEIHILTADTFGRVRAACVDLPVQIRIVSGDEGSLEKEEITRQLGQDRVVAIGNGYNDHCMLEACALGILIMGPEGCATKALLSADVVVKSIEEALELLLYPQRLVATLRN
ncbi:MAG: ATPase P [Syntrophomonadaceae bacterium]|nr:ATPase P [Syntrophomonadaceae bacterium]